MKELNINEICLISGGNVLAEIGDVSKSLAADFSPQNLSGVQQIAMGVVGIVIAAGFGGYASMSPVGRVIAGLGAAAAVNIDMNLYNHFMKD